MKYMVDAHLREFPFWAGAKVHAEMLTDAEMDILDKYIEECWATAIPTETEINDFMWFELNFIAELLGYANEETLWEELLKRKREKEN